MKKVILMGACVAMLITACKKEKTAPDTVAPTPTPATVSKVTYNADVQRIISANCSTSNCHGGVESPNLTSYTLVKSNITIILNRMNRAEGAGGFMPKGGAKVQANIDKIAQWQTDGLLEK